MLGKGPSDDDAGAEVGSRAVDSESLYPGDDLGRDNSRNRDLRVYPGGVRVLVEGGRGGSDFGRVIGSGSRDRVDARADAGPADDLGAHDTHDLSIATGGRTGGRARN